MCVIVSKCLIFMFVEQLIFVDVFSQLYYPIHAKKQQWRTSVINRLTIPGSLHSRKCGGGGGLGGWRVGNHYHLEIQSSPDNSNILSRKIAKSSSYRELEANNLK